MLSLIIFSCGFYTLLGRGNSLEWDEGESRELRWGKVLYIVGKLQEERGSRRGEEG